MGDRELPRAEDGLAPDRPLAVHEWGPAAGRALVFWPGLNPWGSLQLVEVGPLLADRGIHVLAIEPPGIGGSPALDDPDAYLPSRLARLVLAVAEAHGLDRFAYMGHSWGGSIGVHLAADHPDRVAALVLLDAGYDDYPTEQSREELVRLFEADQERFTFDSWAAYLDWVRGRVREWRPSLEPRYREGMTERDGKIVPRSSARAVAWARHGVAVEPVTATHARLSMPILLLLSADADASAFVAAVPHAVVHRLDAGHDVPEDAPDETARLVADWLG